MKLQLVPCFKVICSHPAELLQKDKRPLFISLTKSNGLRSGMMMGHLYLGQLFHTLLAALGLGVTANMSGNIYDYFQYGVIQAGNFVCMLELGGRIKYTY